MLKSINGKLCIHISFTKGRTVSYIKRAWVVAWQLRAGSKEIQGAQKGSHTHPK